MEFFNIATPVSSYPSLSWAYPYGVQDTLEPSRPLFSPYSKPHIQQPKNDDPNIAYPTTGTLAARAERYDPLVSLPKHLHLWTEGTQHACGCGRYLQRLSISVHSPNRISGSANLDTEPEGPLSKPGSDTWSPKLCDNSNCLLNESSFENPTFNKAKTFIETKVTAINCRVLTFN